MVYFLTSLLRSLVERQRCSQTDISKITFNQKKTKSQMAAWDREGHAGELCSPALLWWMVAMETSDGWWKAGTLQQGARTYSDTQRRGAHIDTLTHLLDPRPLQTAHTYIVSADGKPTNRPALVQHTPLGCSQSQRLFPLRINNILQSGNTFPDVAVKMSLN